MPDQTTTPTNWRKSSYSGGSGNCVEIAATDRTIAVRDSKNPNGGILSTTSTAWAQFLAVLGQQ